MYYHSSRNHHGVSNTPILIAQTVTMIMVAMLIFQMSNIAKKTTAANEAATKPSSSSSVTVTPDNYTYTVYGQFHQLSTIQGGNGYYGLAAFEPYTCSKDGIRYYEEYGWRSCYVPLEALREISNPIDPEDPSSGFYDPSEERYFKVEMANEANGGGYISLPSVVLKVEEITARDIPAWSGL